MPKMVQATIGLPLKGLSESGFPLTLLQDARFLRFLRQDTYGFQASYEVQASGAEAFKNRLWQQYENIQGIPRLSWDEETELETLLVRGYWVNERREDRDQSAKTLRCLAGCQDYLLFPPKVAGKNLRISIGGERSKVMLKIARFDKLGVPHRVAELVELAPG